MQIQYVAQSVRVNRGLEKPEKLLLKFNHKCLSENAGPREIRLDAHCKFYILKNSKILVTLIE